MKYSIPAVLFFTFFLIVLIGCRTGSDNSGSEEIDSSSLNTLKDIDGNIYQTVLIGKSVWMKENLKTTHYRNGDAIPNIKDSATWVKERKGAYCNYNNDTSLVRTYGRLYNWYAVDDKRNICPVGWHVATWTEFDDLNFQYGGTNVSGKFLKEAGILHWEEPNDGTNESKFTGLPGGTRIGGFGRLGSYAFFWNKEDYLGDACSEDNMCANECSLTPISYFNHDWGFKNRGMSVRCVKDTLDVK